MDGGVEIATGHMVYVTWATTRPLVQVGRRQKLLIHEAEAGIRAGRNGGNQYKSGVNDHVSRSTLYLYADGVTRPPTGE